MVLRMSVYTSSVSASGHLTFLLTFVLQVIVSYISTLEGCTPEVSLLASPSSIKIRFHQLQFYAVYGFQEVLSNGCQLLLLESGLLLSWILAGPGMVFSISCSLMATAAS